MGLLVFLRIFLLSVMATAPWADAWGKEGHFMVCKIAEKIFTEKTSKAVLDLLPKSAEGELASVCSWADEIRFHYRWSRPLHFADAPGCTYKYSIGECWKSGDCFNDRGEEGMCVVGAINNYTEQLRSYGDSSNRYNLTESLMFLAHFVGDVHQPLHVGLEADEGGNTVIVHWYRRKSNLHHVWDVDIIDTAMSDFYDDNINSMIEAIQRNITDVWSDEIDHWEKCQKKYTTCANDYAIESNHLACRYAYKDAEQGSTLEDDYFFSRLPIVTERIAQAGVRLASILNRVFDGSVDDMIQSY